MVTKILGGCSYESTSPSWSHQYLGISTIFFSDVILYIEGTVHTNSGYTFWRQWSKAIWAASPWGDPRVTVMWLNLSVRHFATATSCFPIPSAYQDMDPHFSTLCSSRVNQTCYLVVLVGVFSSHHLLWVTHRLKSLPLLPPSEDHKATPSYCLCGVAVGWAALGSLWHLRTRCWVILESQCVASPAAPCG